jgi:RNA polymerase sigma-70 factor (ECF subfamily)
MNPKHRPDPSQGELFEHADFLSRLARGLTGDEHAAADLVQDAYVAALEHPPRSRSALGGWLARVVRNRAFNRRRGDARRSERELNSGRSQRTSHQETPDKALARMEVQRVVFDAILALPEAQRTAVYLRFYEGVPPVIAEQLGAPVKTIKTRLSRGLEALRAQLDEQVDGGHQAWLAALAPFAFPQLPPGGAAAPAPASGGSAAATAGILGGLAMKQVLAVCAALVMALTGWQMLSGDTPGPAAAAGGTPADLELARTQPAVIVVPKSTSATETQAGAREVVAHFAGETLSDPALGALRVRLSWHDGTSAAGLEVFAHSRGVRAERELYSRSETDDDGVVEFVGLAPGEVGIYLERGYVDFQQIITAGETTEVEWTLPEGVVVRGKVLDGEGRPVSGAEIWLDALSFRWPHATRVAKTDSYGSFELRSIDTQGSKLGARADGLQPSVLFDVGEMPADTSGVREITFLLSSRGGGVRGRVIDPEGEPVQGASVHAGHRGGHNCKGPDGRRAQAAKPVPVRTDASGAFVLPGGYATDIPVHAQAPGYPTWSDQVAVEVGRTTELVIQLERGAIIEGVVLDAQSRAVAEAVVICALERNGGWYEHAFPAPVVRTDTAGRYRMELVPTGSQSFNARGDDKRLGRDNQQLFCRAGETNRLDFTLNPHPLVSGRVVDGDGNPLMGWRVNGAPAGMNRGFWYPRMAKTDAGGAFLLANVGQFPMQVEVFAPNEWHPARAKLNVDPDTEDVELVVEQLVQTTGHVSGEVRAADGSIPLHVKLLISSNADLRRGDPVDFDARTGAFHHGPIDVGGYTMWLWGAMGTLLISAPFEVEADKTTNIDLLSVEAGGHVELVVEGAAPEIVAKLRLGRPLCATEELELVGDRLVSREILAGEWTLECSQREIYVRQQIEVVSGQTRVVHVELQRAAPLRLELEFANDDWADVVITVTGEGGTELARKTLVPAYFASPTSEVRFNLPLASVQVEAVTNNGLCTTAAFDMGDGSINSVPQSLRLE